MENSKRYIKAFFVFVLFMFVINGETLVFPPYRHSHGIRKATQAHLFMFLPFTRFDDPQGLATAKMVARDDPSTENDDDEVVVYGVNSGRHQLIYNTSMWGLATYGKKGSGKDHFKFPKGIACDPHGNVYVVDSGNNRIVHLFNPKKRVRWVKAFNAKSSGNKGLKNPSQVGLDKKGNIYVTDTGNRRIVVFDSKGVVVRNIPRSSSIAFVNGPTTIAVADGKFEWSYFKREQAVFCADSGGARIWKIDFMGKVKKVASLPKGYSAGYGAVDYYHNFWVTDKKKHCILKYNHDLKLLDIFGSYGKDDNQFVEPRGIAIWKRYGQTFVAEKAGAQYYWIGTDLKKKSLRKYKKSELYVLNTDLTEYSYINLFCVNGTDTTKILGKYFIFAGSNSLSFNNKKNVDMSKCKLILRIEPTYSSYTYYHWDYPIKLIK